MVPVAVCRFAQQKIGARGRFWILQDGLIVAANVAGENHQRLLPVFHNRQLEPGRSKNVSRVVRPDGKLRADRERFGARNHPELLKRRMRFRNGIKRQRRLVRAVTLLRRVLRVFFLYVCGIGKQERAKFLRSRVGIDRPAKPAPRKPRQIARVVDVRVRQQHPIDRRRVDGELIPVALLQLL